MTALLFGLPPAPPAKGKPVAAVTASLRESTAGIVAVAAFELPSWQKQHPKADVDLILNDDRLKGVVPALRKRLGCATAVPNLDSFPLTMVFDPVRKVAKSRFQVDAWVFYGSFPKGIYARYSLTEGPKGAKVLARQILERYEIVPRKPDV